MAKKQPPKASALPAEAPKTPSDSKAVDGKQKRAVAAQPAQQAPRLRAPAREFSPEFKAAVCRDALMRIADGETTVAVAKDHGVDLSCLYRWLDETPDAYALARQDRAHRLFEQLQVVANEPVPSTAQGSYDSAAVADKRLRVDTYKWMASKLLPKTYGDKLELDGKIEISMAQRLKSLSSDDAQAHEALPGE